MELSGKFPHACRVGPSGAFLAGAPPAHAYNGCMKNAFSNLHHTATALLLLALCTAASAQNAAPAPDAPQATSNERPQKAIERIRTEDAGSRIDEVRVGGETQSITVQPKTGSNVPAYEVRPADNAKGSAPGSTPGGTTGSRVWNVMKF